jgi:hypothetical protein
MRQELSGKVPYGRVVAISWWIRKTRDRSKKKRQREEKNGGPKERYVGLKRARRSAVVNGVGSVWWLSTQVPTWSLP